MSAFVTHGLIIALSNVFVTNRHLLYSLVRFVLPSFAKFGRLFIIHSLPCWKNDSILEGYKNSHDLFCIRSHGNRIRETID